MTCDTPGTEPKYRWRQPGEVVDRNGVPIHPGDLVRTFHFRDRRRRKHYLYHTAVLRDQGMWLVPTSHLDPGKATHPDSRGGTCPLGMDGGPLWDAEVISGVGPRPHLDYTDRPKRLPALDPTESEEAHV